MKHVSIRTFAASRALAWRKRMCTPYPTYAPGQPNFDRGDGGYGPV